MEIAVRPPIARHAAVNRPQAHRCPQCRTAAMVLQRRHVSPPRWGEPVVTEYYDCDFCDASYTYSPAQNVWRPIAR